VWGVHCVETEDAVDLEDMVDRACIIAYREAFARAGDRIAITAGVPLGTPGATNMLRTAFVRQDGAGSSGAGRRRPSHSLGVTPAKAGAQIEIDADWALGPGCRRDDAWGPATQKRFAPVSASNEKIRQWRIFQSQDLRRASALARLVALV